MKYEDTWDLDTVFLGGTQSPVLQAKVKAVQADMKAYE